MTITKFLLFSFLQWLFLTVLKIYFFNTDVVANPGLESLLYWFLTLVIVVAMVRRLGVINFMESLLIVFVWVVGDLLSDLIITSISTGTDIFKAPMLWIGYLVAAISIFLLHKKRHVEMRKSQHGHH